MRSNAAKEGELMSDTPQTPEEQGGLKKVSLADAIKNKLAQKKQDQANQKLGGKQAGANSNTMKSQMTKKVNNQRRRTGGS
jgi:hypothetical protein